ncbi:MAG TPA: serine/threonine-protein kinase [Streptosporangiaceae bacterium]|nr:serine/threonine-protein kinase [Streptosporangiaceae bacterium]
MGRYRLAARLGSGGMGRVYLGFSPAGRAVAVKVIRPELARDHGFIRRFRREVAAARMVNGLYTATVVDAGADAPWLATAFVPGPSLADAVEMHGPLAEDPLWRLAAGLAEALVAVHACGLVHRDLKPANVLLAADGPRVIDFGISLALEGTALTGTGLTVGTPGFMSPEQADGERAGPASDVFSLGSVLAYAATGTGPFGGGQPASVIYRVVHAEPELAGVPGQLRDLIARCLAKDPAQRPALAELMDSAAQQAPAGSVMSFWPPGLSEFIASYLADLAVPAAPPAVAGDSGGKPPARREATEAVALHPPQQPGPPTAPGRDAGLPASPAALASPAAGPLATASPPTRPSRRRARRGAVVTAALLCAAGITATVLASQLSPGSTGHPPRRRHPGTSRTAPRPRLVRTLTDPGARGFTPATHVSAVAFSPDGKTLAASYDTEEFAGYTDLWRTATGRLAGTLDDRRSFGVLAMQFSPDGKTLATGDYGAFTDLWDTAARHRRATLTAPGTGSSGVTAVAFSPDGRTLATGDSDGQTYLWDTATGRRTVRLTEPGSAPVTAVAFSPDGRTLATGGFNLSTYLWDVPGGAS